MGIDPSAFVIGTVLARRQHVKSSAARNRAGLLMAVGGMTPMGIVLAESAIRSSRKAEAARDTDTKGLGADASEAVVVPPALPAIPAPPAPPAPTIADIGDVVAKAIAPLGDTLKALDESMKNLSATVGLLQINKKAAA